MQLSAEGTTMSVISPPESLCASKAETFQQVWEALGRIPLDRIRMRPPPGTAVEQDVIDVEAKENRLCELVDSTLVEKAMGFGESALAALFIELLGPFIRSRNLGIITGEGGMMRLMAGLVRIPDVAFTSWTRIPGGRYPDKPVPALAPDLAIEILSESNTPAEMDRKCEEYFQAHVRLVWRVDPRARTISVYTAVNRFVVLKEADTLTGGEVLPGWCASVGEIFAELDRRMTAGN